MRRWLAPSRAIKNSGRSIGRVWVLSDPITEYERWQLDVAPCYHAVGERIQTLSEAEALARDLPDRDFWIFDDELVAVLNFEDHVICGAELITNRSRVRRYLAYRDVAVTMAREITMSQRST